MKSNTNLKVLIIITLGILFTLALIITVSLSTGNDNEINLDHEGLKSSGLSERIHIINNSGWVEFRNAGNCTGSGTYSDPYVIEDLEIDGEGSGYCIFIENSDVYFRIENCTLYNSGGSPTYDDAAIKLLNVDNSQLINNNCSSNVLGLNLVYCDKNTISENVINDNSWSGMRLIESDHNIISGNSVNNNNNYGILTCSESDFTNISKNVLENNKIVGIYSNGCKNNTISGNTVYNSLHGIYIAFDIYDSILGNIAHKNIENGLFLRVLNCLISGNDLSHNGINGIYLVGWWEWSSGNNRILGNIANYNYIGICLEEANDNIISGNTLIGNVKCFVEVNCQGNVIQDNYCILSLVFFPIILAICIPVIGVSTFIIVQNHNKFKKVSDDVDYL
jgi:parallel beta-helix repeat protein